MRPTPLLVALALLAASGAHAQPSAPVRPSEDVARDAARKPAEMVAFAGIKPGDKVGDLIPGGGYFTRVFAGAVGPTGTVYALVPASTLERHPEFAEPARKIAAEPGYANVKVVILSAANPPPVPLDVIWTAQNYHDVHNIPGAVPGFNKAVYGMLRPGGTYVVLDHAAAAGSGVRDTNTLHRIDPAVVKAEVVEAGFVYDGETTVLANPADDHSKIVFDPAVRGHTDQFAYRFHKPA